MANSLTQCNPMDSMQVGKAVFVKESYTTLGIEPRTYSNPGRSGDRCCEDQVWSEMIFCQKSEYLPWSHWLLTVYHISLCYLFYMSTVRNLFLAQLCFINLPHHRQNFLKPNKYQKLMCPRVFLSCVEGNLYFHSWKIIQSIGTLMVISNFMTSDSPTQMSSS